jgi:flagellin-like protein
MKKSVKNKRGISPVIASVLMVLLVVVLAGMVFLWARGFISEQIEKFGAPIEQQCADISFEAVRIGNYLEVVNRGNVNIRSLDIKLIKGGTYEFHKFDFSVNAGTAVKEPVTLEMRDNTAPDEIVLYPALIGNVVGESSNKVFTCLDYGEILPV